MSLQGATEKPEAVSGACGELGDPAPGSCALSHSPLYTESVDSLFHACRPVMIWPGLVWV